MNTTEKELMALLASIQGNGSFETSGVKNFTLPGLRIEGVGEIGLPLNPVQLKEIINLARKAPFGKGSQTVTDTSVRSAWEVDADQLSFHHKAWKKFIKKIVKEVKIGLGIEDQSIKASLYKLLIYEQGDFFLPHQDSEKEKDMFGTLVLGLPSKHSGGELIIRYDGREKVVDFSQAASNYKMPYAAFYADCEHEIKAVISGYRVCLVYNLIKSPGSQHLGVSQFMEKVDEMVDLLTAVGDAIKGSPKAILLGHQYTPANFSLDNLKHHDSPRAQAIIAAAEKAGYFAKLGLVTHYQMGELEGVDFYSSYHNRYRGYSGEADRGTMGEVYEETTTIEHWSDDEMPPLGNIDIIEEDLLTELEIGEGDAIEEEEEGYTGNAGMTMEYWYHYGAIIFWPKRKHFDLLQGTPVSVRLKWMEYYLHHWDDVELHSQVYARQLISGFAGDNWKQSSYDSVDFSIVADILAKIKEETFLKENGEAILVATFAHIKIKSWIELLQHYQPEIFTPIFQKVAGTNDIDVIHHLLKVLIALDSLNSPSLNPFLLEHIQNIPDYLSKVKLGKVKETTYYYRNEGSSRKETIIAIVEKVLGLSQHKEADDEWIQRILKSMTSSLNRGYVNEVLSIILLSLTYNHRVLAKILYEVCVKDLSRRTKEKPMPLPNWKRSVPNTKDDLEVWEILKPFLQSTTQQVFEYRANQSYRDEMANAINRLTIDLKMETIRRGSPHTLKLTKTQAAYEKSLEKWKEDVKLLKQLQALNMV